MRHRPAAFLALALFATVAGAKDERCGLVSPAPAFGKAFPSNAVIVEYRFEVSCAGIGSIEGIPDGWSTRIDYDGENAQLHVSRDAAEAWLQKLGIPDRKASNEQLEAMKIGVLWRGQWSDCMGFDAMAIAMVPAADGTWQRLQVDWTSDWGDIKWKRKDAAPTR